MSFSRSKIEFRDDCLKLHFKISVYKMKKELKELSSAKPALEYDSLWNNNIQKSTEYDVIVKCKDGDVQSIENYLMSKRSYIL